MCETSTKKTICDYIFYAKNKIGEGAYSQVFKGNHQKTGEKTAIKVISLDKTKKGDNFKYIQMEVTALYKLKNTPNNIDVKIVVQTQNNIYIITQFCQSGNLRQLIKRQKKFSEKNAIDIIQQIINGYRSIAKANILHRDLKPDNIFIHNSKIKIGDFGFAINANACEKPLHQNIGSPLYMAPQALITNKYSFQSDIWAIGLIFYELIKGVSPWKSKTQLQLKTQLLQYGIQRFLPSNISQKSKEFLTKCLQKEPSKRLTLCELFQFTFEEDSLQIQNQLSPIFKEKSNNGDKSTVAQVSKQMLTKQSLIQDNNSKHHLESNKSVPNLSMNRCKKLQTKKTFSYQNQHQEKIDINSAKLFNNIKGCSMPINQIKQESTQCLNQSTNAKQKLKKVVSRQNLFDKNVCDPQKKEQTKKQTPSIDKLLHKSSSIVFTQKFNLSSKNIIVPFVSSVTLQQLPQFYQNQQEDDETIKILKQNNFKYKNQKQGRSKQFDRLFLNSQIKQSIYVDNQGNKPTETQVNESVKHPFEMELMQIKSQIFYFMFLNQIIKNISTYLKTSNEKVQLFKRNMIFLVFQKLEQLNSLKLLKLSQKQKEIFSKTQEFTFIKQLIHRFLQKYQQKYNNIKPQFKNHKEFIVTLSFVLRLVHQNSKKYQHSQEEMNKKKMIVIILESLVNFSLLYFLDKQQNWVKFQLKSNVCDIATRAHPIKINKEYCERVNKKYLQLIEI